jgi:hypothetical protein
MLAPKLYGTGYCVVAAAALNDNATVRPAADASTPHFEIELPRIHHLRKSRAIGRAGPSVPASRTTQAEPAKRRDQRLDNWPMSLGGDHRLFSRTGPDSSSGRERSTVKSIVVRYETAPGRAEENQRLIEKVFAELAERAPDDFGYASLQLEDGVTFVHIVRDAGTSGFELTDLPAFQEFLAGIGDRCTMAPLAQGATVIGEYGLLAR